MGHMGMIMPMHCARALQWIPRVVKIPRVSNVKKNTTSDDDYDD